AIGYNAYMNDYKTTCPMPANGRFLDDMSIVYPYVSNIGVFSCPSTKTPRPQSVKDLELQLKDSGNSIVLNSSVKDYIGTVYEEWLRTIYNGSLVNEGHGTSSYGINPDNPSGNFDLSSAEKGGYIRKPFRESLQRLQKRGICGRPPLCEVSERLEGFP
ncbi:MAG TPA: hypothetical protein PK821_04545, partial [Victivallales bacterium]|nr:hypothetical protein [Victivallales bacterium]